ncbi:hypothetical protein E2C01_028798 [Portunus trituberculatus]|uniref:Uncharacterized protein n=1 Tax=Portunus trituberculatus TaxID=210409 RepID=A0A5B7EQ70_PORTR|nr:hypothetical protein [Portunus trituberculatus]
MVELKDEDHQPDEEMSVPPLENNLNERRKCLIEASFLPLPLVSATNPRYLALPSPFRANHGGSMSFRVSQGGGASSSHV